MEAVSPKPTHRSLRLRVQISTPPNLPSQGEEGSAPNPTSVVSGAVPGGSPPCEGELEGVDEASLSPGTTV